MKTPLIKCEDCGAPLSGMSDSIVRGPSKLIVCRDRVGCDARVKEARELASKMMNEMYSHDGKPKQ